MADYTKSQLGRASAVLTTGEVAGATLFLGNAKNKQVVVDLSFTIGMLTNVTVRFYGSMDGTNFDVITDGDNPLSEALTASAERMFVMPPLPGIKFFRATVQGSGTVTDSLCAFDYRYERLGAP